VNNGVSQIEGLLILPHLKVQGANAISSPLTWGFPSPTAFVGFVHALERRLSGCFGKSFGGVGIVCHGFDAQVSKPNRRQHFIFTQSRNPVYLQRDAPKFISAGTPAAIVEEGRAHLEVSLVVPVLGGFDEKQEEDQFAVEAYDCALSMRIAGGSVLPPSGLRQPKPQWVPWPAVATEQRKAFVRLRRQLLPGFALVHRPDLLAERLVKLRVQDIDANALDALLDITRRNYAPVQPEAEDNSASTSDSVEWQAERRPGWLVPLPIGYAGISKLYSPGEVSGARDDATPFRFVESLYSLGQWVSPHRLTELGQIIWNDSTDSDAGLYRCVNRYAELSEFRNETEQTRTQGA